MGGSFFGAGTGGFLSHSPCSLLSLVCILPFRLQPVAPQSQSTLCIKRSCERLPCLFTHVCPTFPGEMFCRFFARTHEWVLKGHFGHAAQFLDPRNASKPADVMTRGMLPASSLSASDHLGTVFIKLQRCWKRGGKAALQVVWSAPGRADVLLQHIQRVSGQGGGF